MSEQSAQLKRWITLIVLAFVATTLGGIFFCWVIVHEIADLKDQVADLRQVVIVDQNARIRQAEVVINDIESSLMPGIANVKTELKNIGAAMQEVKAHLRGKDSHERQ
jgi:hypothetical protein